MNQWIEQIEIVNNNGKKSGKVKYFHVHNGHEHSARLTVLTQNKEWVLKPGCFCPLVEIKCDVCGVIRQEHDQVVVARL